MERVTKLKEIQEMLLDKTGVLPGNVSVFIDLSHEERLSLNKELKEVAFTNVSTTMDAPKNKMNELFQTFGINGKTCSWFAEGAPELLATE